MVEQKPVTDEQIVAISIIDGHPIGIDLRCCIGALRMKSSILILRRRRAAKHFAAGRLIKASFYPAAANRLQQASCAQTRDVARILRHIKTDPNVALSAKIINLVRLDIVDKMSQLFRIAEVAIGEK